MIARLNLGVRHSSYSRAGLSLAFCVWLSAEQTEHGSLGGGSKRVNQNGTHLAGQVPRCCPAFYNIFAKNGRRPVA